MMRRLGVLLGLWIWSQPAHADEARELERQVQARFHEGVVATDAGRLEQARLAFAQAYALRRSPTIAFNLGKVEMRLGKFVDAAQHFAAALSDPGPTDDVAQAEARKALGETLEKIGTVIVSVNVDAADISVDGHLVGRSPLRPDQLFVAPGLHTFRASKDGYHDAQLTRTLDIAQQIKINLELMPLASAIAAPAAASTAPAPVASNPSPPMPTEPTAAPPSKARPIALGIGAGATVVAAAAGTYFALRLSSARDDVTAYQSQTPAWGCSTGSPQCGAIAEAVDHRNAMARDANIAFALAAGFGVATVGMFLLWPKTTVQVGPSAVTLHSVF